MAISVSARQAQRIAVAAQGFGTAPAPADTVGTGQLLRLVRRLGLHQIDSVNVVTRAHYLPAFSRLGGYDTALLDAIAWGPRRQRRLFEYWAHEASLLPLDLHPLFRWRMARGDRGEAGYAGLRAFATTRRAEAEAVLARIAAEGPLAASDFPDGKGQAGWWEWGPTKRALEWLFYAGHITTATRRRTFERVYDLTERVIPAAILALPTPSPAEAQRALVDRAARALGIATTVELRDYFRLRPAEATAAIADLVDDGTLLPAAVEGWRHPAWLHRDAVLARRDWGDALLAPFDPLVWERDRTERLFGFRYRIEIYTPAARRTYGYYVLPYLLDGQLVGRVDAKADRAGGTLLARLHLEPTAGTDAADRATAAIDRLAAWLGLERVVLRRG
ncbi:winged helix-turn-helix domain-containing protein [Sphingomonas sp. 1P08PE]|uniref:winged helix-turn-helix domain-containing protein n=1 Tax=Sphingomonas sp. 1P08PE TaxID=554122 RepID=UPI0039A3A233